MPLPDGLNFTPAMTARIMLSNDLKLVEREMPYSEREGRSKLRLFADGIRFLSVILENSVPSSPDSTAGADRCFADGGSHCLDDLSDMVLGA